MELQGKLDSWHDDKGFGFIRPENNGSKLFVHISAVRGDTRPKAGDEVMYVVGKDEQGRAKAVHMRHVGLSIDRPVIQRKPTEKSENQPTKIQYRAHAKLTKLFKI